MDGAKITEFRSINTNIRGRVYVYASKKRDAETIYDSIRPTGMIVGTVEITGSKKVGNIYHWSLRNPRRLRHPIKPKNHPQPIFFNPF